MELLVICTQLKLEMRVIEMGKILLRETYDKNLNEVIRLKGLESGQSILAVIKKGKKVPNIQSLASPIFAHICVTDQCNLKCPYCYANDSTHTNDMSYEQMIKLVDKCNDSGVLCITWTGGEPLTKKSFLDIVLYAHYYGIRQTILTNGTLVYRVIEENWPKDNINFQISLNNVWESYDNVSQIIKYTALLFRAGYSVVLTIMLEPLQISRYEELFDELIENEIPATRLGYKMALGAAHDLDHSSYTRKIKKLIPDLIKMREKYCNKINIRFQFDKRDFVETGFPRRFIMCEAGTTQIYIDNNGDVYPCPLLKSYTWFYCGNIFLDSWSDVWNSKPMRFMREIPECSNCNYTCGVWCRALKYAADGSFYGKSNYCLKDFD